MRRFFVFMASTNGNAKEAIDLSIQRRVENPPSGGIYQWWFSRPVDYTDIAPWWSPQRDRDLRLFWQTPGNDILQGAIASMTKWGKTLAWVLDGPKRSVPKFQDVLSNAEFGEGWGTFVDKGLQDYYSQDKGWTMEFIGRGDPNGMLEGPVLGIAHLDSQYVQPTGDPVYPIIYYNPKDGKPHRIHVTRVGRIVDMPSPNELMCGIGFCAVSRVIASSQVLMKLNRFKNEKLSDMPEAGLLLLNNILPKQWEDVHQNHESGRRRLGQQVWNNIMTLFSVDPSKPATADFVSFANIPDGFDELTSTNLYVAVVALAFGVDPREFFPMSQGRLGSATESSVMAEKAEGKGKGDIIAAIERVINWKVLPENINFRFDFRNEEQDRREAEINKTKIDSIMKLWDQKSYQAGLDVPVRIEEIRQMLADNVPDYFMPEFLEADITDETELTDTERKSYVAVNGHSLDEVLSIAEKNYKEGKCSLDDLIEFNLGALMDSKPQGIKATVPMPPIQVEMPAPVINVSVPPIEFSPQINIPEQPTPIIQMPAPIIQMPAQKPKSIEIERDESGRIKRAVES